MSEKTKPFNIRWPASAVVALDAIVESTGGGPAHGTRASRSSVLLKIFEAHLTEPAPAAAAPKRKPRRQSPYPDPDHPGWARFEWFWERSPKRGSKKRAWDAWRTVWKDISEALEDGRLVAAWGAAHQDGGEFAREKKYIPHFSTWILGRPWDVERPDLDLAIGTVPDPPPPEELTEEDLALRRALFDLANRLPATLPPARAAARFLLEVSAGVHAADRDDLAGVLERVEEQLMRRLKKWAGTPEGFHLAQAVVAEAQALFDQRDLPLPESWDDLVAIARVDGEQRALVAEAWINVVRSEPWSVPKLELNDA